MTQRPSAFLASAVAIVASCTFDGGAGDNATVLCVDDGDCPAALVCNSFRHICQDEALAGDVEAPRLRDAVFDPPVLRAGAATLRLLADEAIDVDAPVVVDIDPPGLALTLVTSVNSATLEFVATVPDDGGDARFLVRGVTWSDAAGNTGPSSPATLPALLVDRTAPSPPVLSVRDETGALVARPRLAPNPCCDQATLTARGEAGATYIVAATGGLNADCDDVVEQDLVVGLRGALTLAGDTDDVAATISVTDAAGNADAASVIFDVDATAPVLVLVEPQVNGAAGDVVAPGDGAAIRLTSSEPASFAVDGSACLGGVASIAVCAVDTSAGQSSFVVVATDVLGNTSDEAVVTFQRRDTRPSPCAPASCDDACDVDGDGEAGVVAGVVLDCNDGDPLASSGQSEIPFDDDDNDCDGFVDETAGAIAFVAADDTFPRDLTAVAGSAANPFQSAGVAVQSGARLLLLQASGVYRLPGGVAVVGGFDRSWRRAAGVRSAVRVDGAVVVGDALVGVAQVGGTGTVLVGAGAVVDAALSVVRVSGRARLSDLDLLVDAAGAATLDIDEAGGGADLRNVRGLGATLTTNASAVAVHRVEVAVLAVRRGSARVTASRLGVLVVAAGARVDAAQLELIGPGTAVTVASTAQDLGVLHLANARIATNDDGLQMQSSGDVVLESVEFAVGGDAVVDDSGGRFALADLPGQPQLGINAVDVDADAFDADALVSRGHSLRVVETLDGQCRASASRGP